MYVLCTLRWSITVTEQNVISLGIICISIFNITPYRQPPQNQKQCNVPSSGGVDSKSLLSNDVDLKSINLCNLRQAENSIIFWGQDGGECCQVHHGTGYGVPLPPWTQIWSLARHIQIEGHLPQCPHGVLGTTLNLLHLWWNGHHCI